ncbi:histidine phosphatase family protein [Saprospiraceae bacterium]|nr:histidine phosphatase family protein [Saprospiraceae bacterium]
MKYLASLFIALMSFLLFFTISSCEPETIIQTEIVTVTDTIIVSTTDTLFVTTVDTVFLPDVAEITYFIFVKHAEKGDDGTSDPELTEEGIARAENLAFVLSELNLDRIYSTDYNRTMQTAMPTAEEQGLSITIYGGFDHNQVIDDILENQSEGRILISGHSNTTPNFLNALTGTSDYEVIEEDVYDNLYIVKVKSKGDSEVTHLKY